MTFFFSACSFARLPQRTNAKTTKVIFTPPPKTKSSKAPNQITKQPKTEGIHKTPPCPEPLPIPAPSKALDPKAPKASFYSCPEYEQHQKDIVFFLNSSKQAKDPARVFCFVSGNPETASIAEDRTASPSVEDSKKSEESETIEPKKEVEETPKSESNTLINEKKTEESSTKINEGTHSEPLTRLMYTPHLLNKPLPDSVPRFSTKLASMMYQIAKHFGKNQITIISGLRSKEAAAQKGNRESLHTLGQACDFYINGVPSVEVFDYVRSTYQKKEGQKNQAGVGVIYYPRWSRDFVHLEVRSDSYFYDRIELATEKEPSHYCVPPPPPLSP